MTNINDQHVNYQRIQKAIYYLNQNQEVQPSLSDIAQYVGVSDFHLQRIFSDWAGVSPKQFLQYLTKEKAKEKLRNHSVMDAALSCGLSGSSRLHDLMISYECVTPGEYKSWGKGLLIHYGVHRSPFGFCFIATTKRGICKLAFFDEESEQHPFMKELIDEWPNAVIQENEADTYTLVQHIFDKDYSSSSNLNMLLKGSPFQIKVWEALLKIPKGSIVSYQNVANEIGDSNASRAVASAIAKNRIGYLIPCHRVIRSTGALSNYRWGSDRKAALIGWEECNLLPL